jgi:Fic family protein
MSINPDSRFQWEPIKDLSKEEISTNQPELNVLASIWLEHAGELKNSQALNQFNEKMARSWAIETGIIEGLYKIDRGITEHLINKGIESAIIPHGFTDKPAEEIVRVLKDHQSALEGIFDFVASRRNLSTSYIKELHQALCAHQNTVEAMDQFGNFFKLTLKKGEWKKNPNNPHRDDGYVHEYCPPDQVSSEMDNLITMHLQHTENSVSPEIEAAWLHHRFSQIHPFQDGNGRVARALATLILLRAKLFPYVVDRSDRSEYISCLEKADKGDLNNFIEMISLSQRRAMTKALSLSEAVLSDEKDINVLIQAGTKTLMEKKEVKAKNLEQVYKTSDILIDNAVQQMEEVAQKVNQSLQSIDQHYGCNVSQSDESNSYWFYSQVVETAKRFEYYADLRRYHSWIRMKITESQSSSIVVSFHPLGTTFRGMMTVSAFYEERTNDGDKGHSVVPSPVPLSHEVFNYTYSENSEDVAIRLAHWLHEALVVGLTQWKKSM